MSFAVAEFMSRNPQIRKVTMKYSTPGHSAVQEVDNMHSTIEKAMASSEFYSPVSFIRVLLKANRKNPYTVIQMKETDFKDYQACSKLYKYKQIPFASVAQIGFSHCLFSVKYTTSHSQTPTQVDIRGIKTRYSSAMPSSVFPKPKTL